MHNLTASLNKDELDAYLKERTVAFPLPVTPLMDNPIEKMHTMGRIPIPRPELLLA